MAALLSAVLTFHDQLEQFTVIAFIFDAEGTLRARQASPARRTLDAHSTKYSTMVLDRVADRCDRRDRGRRQSGTARRFGHVVANRP
jgi:hypothetical protein